MKPRTIEKLEFIIQQVDTQYDIMSDIQADGQTTGFTAECLGNIFNVRQNVSKT